jgi:hypothetical protein
MLRQHLGPHLICASHVLPVSTLMQVILADKFGDGSFSQMWQRLSHPYPVMQLPQAMPDGKHLCFKEAIHSHYCLPDDGLTDKHGQARRTSTCLSTIMLGMAHWQRSLFGGPTSITDLRKWDTHSNVDPTLPGAGHRRLKVTFASRSWFSRGMRAGAGLTGWQASRDLSPQQEVAIIAGLQKAVGDWNARACVRPSFGWWQNDMASPMQQESCRPSNVSFELQVGYCTQQDSIGADVCTLPSVAAGAHSTTSNRLLGPARCGTSHAELVWVLTRISMT